MAIENTDNLPVSTPRDMAVSALTQLQRSQYQKRLRSLIDLHFQPETSPQDRRFAYELALGTCCHQITLDHIITRYSSRPLRRIDPIVLWILRLGLYQMIYLSGTPDFAALDQAVRQANTFNRKNADSFINAVLRNIQRDSVGRVDSPQKGGSLSLRETLAIQPGQVWQFRKALFPDPKKNTEKYLSLALGYPPWLIKRFLRYWPGETVERIALAGNARPLLTLRVNRLLSSVDALAQRFTDAGIPFRTDHLSALQIPQPIWPESLPGFSDGLFSVQDQTQQHVARALSPQPGWKVLDLCAGPGGKTSHLAECMNNQGLIVACNTSLPKHRQLLQNCRRLKIDIVQSHLMQPIDPEQQDYKEDNDTIAAEQIPARFGLFDAVLLDVPCSNTAVLARRPELRHRLRPSHITALTRLQRQILALAPSMVTEEGTILYSTCSIDPAENENIIQQFLDDTPAFHLLFHKTTLPFAGSTEQPPSGLPFHDGGFFAILRKNEPG